jgi:diaminopimelate decarboxylase
MKPFHYKNNDLYCGTVPIKTLAEKFGTPLYVTSAQSIQEQYASFEDAFKILDPLICYAVKANANLSILHMLKKAGAGADVGGSGELYKALQAGISPNKIVVSGVGKTKADIEYALGAQVLALKAESGSEILLINSIAEKMRISADIMIRINPRVTVDTHKHISTGDIGHKFGIEEKVLLEFLGKNKNLNHINIIGLCIHIGSQIADPKAYAIAIKNALHTKNILEQRGHAISYFSVGGGFPITYDAKNPKLILNTFSKVIVPLLSGCKAKIIFEPGRYIVGNASALITRALYIKQNSKGKNFIIADAGMTELMRPALYSAHHDIVPVSNKEKRRMKADIVGPVCESTDTFACGRTITRVKEGDLLAILSVGAYGAVMASNYNGRLRPPEVLVNFSDYKIIRKREEMEQLIQNEI